MALYRITAVANARDVPDTATGKILHKLPVGAIVQGTIVTGQNTGGSNQWVNTPEGWFVHTSALASLNPRPSFPGDMLAFVQGKRAAAEDEAAYWRRFEDELAQLGKD